MRDNYGSQAQASDGPGPCSPSKVVENGRRSGTQFFSVVMGWQDGVTGSGNVACTQHLHTPDPEQQNTYAGPRICEDDVTQRAKGRADTPLAVSRPRRRMGGMLITYQQRGNPACT